MLGASEYNVSGQDNKDDLKYDRVQGNQPLVEKDDENKIRQASEQAEQLFTEQEGEQLSKQDKDIQEREQIEESTMQKSSHSYLLQNDKSSGFPFGKPPLPLQDYYKEVCDGNNDTLSTTEQLFYSLKMIVLELNSILETSEILMNGISRGKAG